MVNMKLLPVIQNIKCISGSGESETRQHLMKEEGLTFSLVFAWKIDQSPFSCNTLVLPLRWLSCSCICIFSVSHPSWRWHSVFTLSLAFLEDLFRLRVSSCICWQFMHHSSPWTRQDWRWKSRSHVCKGYHMHQWKCVCIAPFFSSFISLHLRTVFAQTSLRETWLQSKRSLCTDDVRKSAFTSHVVLFVASPALFVWMTLKILNREEQLDILKASSNVSKCSVKCDFRVFLNVFVVVKLSSQKGKRKQHQLFASWIS